jgi:hypothetical protein
MAENTFYFSHDYNTRMDDKIKDLIYHHGFLGYGIYWGLIEDLYNNANALRLHCERIASDYRTQTDVINSIIHDFDLFIIDGNHFHSNGVHKRLIHRETKSTKARESASYRWENANAMRTQCERNAIKERKGKERKGNNIIDSIVELPFNTSDFVDAWHNWKEYKHKQHKFKFATASIEKSALTSLSNLSEKNCELAIQIINQSISNGWKGFFKLKTTQNEIKPTNEDRFNKRIEYAQRWNSSDIEVKEDN